MFSVSHLLHFIPSLCWDLSGGKQTQKESVGRERKGMGRGISQPHDSCREDNVLHQYSLPSPNLPTGDLQHEQGVSSTIHPLYWCHGKGRQVEMGSQTAVRCQSGHRSPVPRLFLPLHVSPQGSCSLLLTAAALHGTAQGAAEQLPWGSQPPTLRLNTPHNQRRIIASESL